MKILVFTLLFDFIDINFFFKYLIESSAQAFNLNSTI
jgi:hypothetical protein